MIILERYSIENVKICLNKNADTTIIKTLKIYKIALSLFSTTHLHRYEDLCIIATKNLYTCYANLNYVYAFCLIIYIFSYKICVLITSILFIAGLLCKIILI